MAECTICDRAVRRSHGGVMVCPRCDLNELPASPTPSVMPRKRPPTQEAQHG